MIYVYYYSYLNKMLSNNIIIRPALSCITELTTQSIKPSKDIKTILLEEYPNMLRVGSNYNSSNITESRVRQLMDFIEEEDITIMEELINIRKNTIYDSSTICNNSNDMLDRNNIHINNIDTKIFMQIASRYTRSNDVDKYIGEIIDDIFRKLSERERYVFYDLSINGTDTMDMQMNCIIQNITEAWDYHGILESYQRGYVTDEEMSKYFFYNEALCCIQTVIIKNLTRYIYTIPENLACKDKLDHYRNVFMRKNAPQDALISNKYLIIDEGCSREASDSILSYIKDNVIVSFNDVKLYHTKLHEDSRLSYKLFMDNLNKMCLDISYKSNTSSSIHEIPIGSYLKATYMVNNKQSIVYVYYNGEIPENVRVPKHIKLG